MTTTVHLHDAEPYVVDWRRLSVWFPQSIMAKDSDDDRAFTAINFLASVRREINHQSMSNRMRQWMAERGNKIVVGSFEEEMRSRGYNV